MKRNARIIEFLTNNAPIDHWIRAKLKYFLTFTQNILSSKFPLCCFSQNFINRFNKNFTSTSDFLFFFFFFYSKIPRFKKPCPQIETIIAFGNDKQLLIPLRFYPSRHHVPHTHTHAQTCIHARTSLFHRIVPFGEGPRPGDPCPFFHLTPLFSPLAIHSPAAFLRASSFCNELPPLASSSSSSSRLPRLDVITYDHLRPQKRDGSIHAYTFGSIHLLPSMKRDQEAVTKADTTSSSRLIDHRGDDENRTLYI